MKRSVEVLAHCRQRQKHDALFQHRRWAVTYLQSVGGTSCSAKTKTHFFRLVPESLGMLSLQEKSMKTKNDKVLRPGLVLLARF